MFKEMGYFFVWSTVPSVINVLSNFLVPGMPLVMGWVLAIGAAFLWDCCVSERGAGLGMFFSVIVQTVGAMLFLGAQETVFRTTGIVLFFGAPILCHLLCWLYTCDEPAYLYSKEGE